MTIEQAPDIHTIVHAVVKNLNLPYIDSSRIVCMRSFNATSRARARIWSFPKIWQTALDKPAYYIIEVLSEHFDKLSSDDKIRVIIHELMHIPKNFSGALVPHRGIHKRIDARHVEQLFRVFKKSL
jgi:predicted metallopeptidase